MRSVPLLPVAGLLGLLATASVFLLSGSTHVAVPVPQDQELKGPAELPELENPGGTVGLDFKERKFNVDIRANLGSPKVVIRPPDNSKWPSVTVGGGSKVGGVLIKPEVRPEQFLTVEDRAVDQQLNGVFRK